jgi:hypothetical protein
MIEAFMLPIAVGTGVVVIVVAVAVVAVVLIAALSMRGRRGVARRELAEAHERVGRAERDRDAAQQQANERVDPGQ